jgi:hypothetical protein
MLPKTPNVSKNDQDCISVLLSLKQGGSPSDTATAVTAAVSLSSSRMSDDWDICNTASCGSMSTTVTASTSMSTDPSGYSRPYLQRSSSAGVESNNTATTTIHQEESRGAVAAAGAGATESKYNDRGPIKVPEPLYQEEEQEEEDSASPTTVSSCFNVNDHDRASLSFFPHMQMIQQHMARNYTGVPLSRPPLPPPPPHPSFYHHDMSYPSNPRRLSSNGGRNNIPSSRSWSPTFPPPSFSMDRSRSCGMDNPQHPSNFVAPSLPRPPSSSSCSMERDCDSLHSHQGNCMSYTRKPTHLHPQLQNQMHPTTNHRPMGGARQSSTSSSSLVRPFVSLSLPAFCNLNDTKTLSNLIGTTSLVDPQDRQYIPDFIFLSMAQLEPCYVTPLDRIGTYKSRKVGFKGMCCKHCGGEPGFGRYFPETIRSLSQTTTTQTIVKHVAYKCRKCPKDVRDSVRALKEYQDAKDHLAKECQRSRFDERPKYGSRKVFFQRLWHRLHGGEMVEDEGGDEGKEKGTKTVVVVKENKNILSAREENQKKDDALEAKIPVQRRLASATGSLDESLEKQNYSPGRQRAVSYEDSDGENVPPSTVLK